MTDIPEDIREAAAKAIEGKGAPRGQIATRVAEAIFAERERWMPEIRRLQDEILELILHRTPEQIKADAEREGVDLHEQGEKCRAIFERAKANVWKTQGNA